MMPQKLALAFFLLATCCTLALSLECYSCYPDEATGKTCDNLEEATIRKCDEEEKFCIKTVLDGETTRSCYKSNTAETSCKSTGETTSCYCSGNYCNSAQSVHFSLLACSSATILLHYLLNK